jgi:hypothetical protein
MAARKKGRKRGRLKWDGISSSSGGSSAIMALATFVTAWVYCTIHYGFLFGFGLGWLPAGMLAALVGALSWLVSPFTAGLLLASLLLIALWRDPELFVWLPLALLAAWMILRRHRFSADVVWIGRRLDRRRTRQSRARRQTANGRFLTALTAFLADGERTRKSGQPTRPPKEPLH